MIHIIITTANGFRTLQNVEDVSRHNLPDDREEYTDREQFKQRVEELKK